MYIVLLTFAENKDRLADFLEAHKAWLHLGFEEGVFLLAGSLQPGLGGGILAHDTSLAALQQRINQDPFVAAKVVNPQIMEITPSLTDPRLQFLVE